MVFSKPMAGYTGTRRKKKKKEIYLYPSDICFSQKYISNRFEDGELIGERSDDLVNEVKTISDIRTIRVVNIHGRWYTLDNRRLWMFRMYQKIKLQRYRYLQIPVLVWKDFETDTQLVFAAKKDGTDVKIHNKDLPGGEQYKKVDSIHTDTYRNPTLALLLDTANLTFNGVTSVVSFVWNGVSRMFRNT